MKKLLIFMLVLGMASIASATLQISVGGVMEPEDTTIYLLPTETIVLDIWTDADIGAFQGGPWMLVVDTTVGSMTPGTALPPMSYGLPAPGYTADNDNVSPPAGREGIWGIAVNTNPMVPILAGTVLYDEIIFHCEDLGDAIIYLMNAPEGSEASIVYDQVTIHQIPEPVTVLLLGLGGLFLRRRK